MLKTWQAIVANLTYHKSLPILTAELGFINMVTPRAGDFGNKMTFHIAVKPLLFRDYELPVCIFESLVNSN